MEYVFSCLLLCNSFFSWDQLAFLPPPPCFYILVFLCAEQGRHAVKDLAEVAQREGDGAGEGGGHLGPQGGMKDNTEEDVVEAGTAGKTTRRGPSRTMEGPGDGGRGVSVEEKPGRGAMVEYSALASSHEKKMEF